MLLWRGILTLLCSDVITICCGRCSVALRHREANVAYVFCVNRAAAAADVIASCCGDVTRRCAAVGRLQWTSCECGWSLNVAATSCCHWFPWIVHLQPALWRHTASRTCHCVISGSLTTNAFVEWHGKGAMGTFNRRRRRHVGSCCDGHLLMGGLVT